MFVYNITSKVDYAIVQEWLQWQKQTHIPEMLATQLFLEYRFYKLLDHAEDIDETFVIQFFCESNQKYEAYLQRFAPALRDKSQKKWADKVVSFRTLLESVQ
jgi:hypothetical protein